MIILAMDTANQPVSVAILKDQEVLGEMTVNIKQTHSQTLLPMIDLLLKQVKLTIKQIDRFVVASGPGSYTGLRIAVTTAKSLAWTLEKELVGISSLKALAAGCNTQSELIVPLFDARRQNVFAGAYSWHLGTLQNQIADQHILLSELITRLNVQKQPILFVGQISDDLKTIIQTQMTQEYRFADETFNLPRASYLGQLGRLQTPVSDIHGFIPNYLRQTEAEVNWAKQQTQQPKDDDYVQQV